MNLNFVCRICKANLVSVSWPTRCWSDAFCITVCCATMRCCTRAEGWNDSLSKQHLPHHWQSPAWGLQVSWDTPHNFKGKFPLNSTHRTLGINEKLFQRWQNYNVASASQEWHRFAAFHWLESRTNTEQSLRKITVWLIHIFIRVYNSSCQLFNFLRS